MSMTMADISLRLRRAILQDDLTLVQRILNKNPSYWENPDYNDKSNTSLHLAAQEGHFQIAQYLVSLSKDDRQPEVDASPSKQKVYLEIPYNTDNQTPLHLAAAYSHSEIVELLCSKLPQMLDKQDKAGCTALHLAARGQAKPIESAPKISTKPPEDTSTIQSMIEHSANVHIQDNKGDTCLHHASAWGNLKAIRLLISQAGADPLCRNNAGWTPEFYSLTVQAEVYYRNLVTEWEKRKAEEDMRRKERKIGTGGGVRLVITDESQNYNTESSEYRTRADSDGSKATNEVAGGLGITIGKGDTLR